MPLILREIRLAPDEDESLLWQKAARVLGIPKDELQNLRIIRQSIDARDKNDVHFKYAAEVTLKQATEEARLVQTAGVLYEKEETVQPLVEGIKPLHLRPVVTGAGPAGLFCALLLAQYGFRPLIIERGRDTQNRIQDFEALCRSGIAQSESNVCFGEGGAGAFSDGKLTTRIKDRRVRTVIDTLAEAGAPQEIRYSAKPHMGTEHIRAAVIHIRKKIISLGGEVWFDTRLSGIEQDRDRLRGIQLQKNGMQQTLETEILVLAIGHSARDTYAMLHESGIVLQKKPFAIGLRIEHPRECIDRSQYGRFFDHPRLGAAEYRLTGRCGQRGVYTFCMCPGGEVVNASTEQGMTAVNGMSYYERKGQNSNSAVVVTIGTADMEEHPLAGVQYQRQWEKACFSLSPGGAAPAQKLIDFMQNRQSTGFGAVQPSIKPCAIPADLNACLPGYVTEGIKKGIADFARQIRGFDMPDAVLTGVETRTSAPLSMPRDDAYQALGHAGIYPCGEGSGHAGGIVSAAVDGLKTAQSIIETYKPCY